ncbi:MAG: hypothetical protein DRJ11_09355 [Candidatus Aminicenantes bacterium]|nr:MAG: hypothetical protein DRJ11_09355 [Candidatus Aminicenantes bacterium]
MGHIRPGILPEGWLINESVPVISYYQAISQPDLKWPVLQSGPNFWIRIIRPTKPSAGSLAGLALGGRIFWPKIGID